MEVVAKVVVEAAGVLRVAATEVEVMEVGT